MKTPLAIILSLTLTGLGPAQEAPKEFEKLETKSGKVYDHVKVRKVEPDGISIMHDAGTAKVLFANLSPEMQSAFKYDPTKAREHRQIQAEADKAALAAEAATQKRKAVEATSAKGAEMDDALRERVRGMGRLVQVGGTQISDIGVIGMIRVMKPTLVAVRGSMIQKDRKWVFDKMEDGVIRKAKGVKAGEVVEFHPNGEKPTSEIEISYNGPAWRMGYIRYKTRQGLLRTCPLFTGSEDDAVAFYRKHGFSGAALKAVTIAD